MLSPVQMKLGQGLVSQTNMSNMDGLLSRLLNKQEERNSKRALEGAPAPATKPEGLFTPSASPNPSPPSSAAGDPPKAPLSFSAGLGAKKDSPKKGTPSPKAARPSFTGTTGTKRGKGDSDSEAETRKRKKIGD